MSQQQEQAFHNDSDSFFRNRRFLEALKPGVVLECIRRGWDLAGDLKGKTILDFGCGYGISIVRLLEKEPHLVVGIDLSSVRISECRARFRERHTEFLVGDCENLGLKGGRFDFVFGNAILHHLDIAKSIAEVRRILKTPGRAVFVEPLGSNIFINMVRKMTPKARTPTERPLVPRDLVNIECCFGGTMRLEYCFLSILPMLLIYRFLPVRLRQRLLSLTCYIDKLLLRIAPFLGPQSWVVIIELRK